MSDYMPARGTVYLVKGKGNKKYKLDPDPFTNEGGPGDTLSYGIIFTGYQLTEQEITAKIACLNDQRVMYTFGKGFGDITINGEVLCGATDGSGGGEKALLDYYEENRVNIKKEALTLSGPKGFTAEFFLTGLTIVQYNTQLEILNFRFQGVLAK
tara:strand:- start:572 stop:1036 length:465 start_codon:yes stop_codon:yes gene_type:complete